MSLSMSISSHPTDDPCACPTSRREFLARAGGGLGLLALADLLQSHASAESNGPTGGGLLAPRRPHFAAKAKAVIWLFMEGGPSGVDLFDRKPELERSHGKKIEIDVFNGS